MERDSTPPVLDFRKGPNITIPTREEWKTMRLIDPQTMDQPDTQMDQDLGECPAQGSTKKEQREKSQFL
ncbi:hypothetical protein JTB14_003149 [Gonioctena quinquepunctata]|nr:hypothetical protein JTB14_003149 [Gonioctena quinquepunctata]